MASFTKSIDPYVTQELQEAKQCWISGKMDDAFRHLERAHILGQISTYQHVRTHWHMLIWGIRTRSIYECVGQITRIVGAIVVTPFGFVPIGNTGGANVSPFEPMEVPQELSEMIAAAKQLSS